MSRKATAKKLPAKGYARFFETRTRNNPKPDSIGGSGAQFVTLVDDAPLWLKNAVHLAHMGDLPSDWVYEECRAVCEQLDCRDDEQKTGANVEYWLDNSAHEYTDSRVDIYTRDLFQWAADECLSSTWSNAESVAEDCGLEDSDTSKRIAVIQYYAIDAIVHTIANAIREHEESEGL